MSSRRLSEAFRALFAAGLVGLGATSTVSVHADGPAVETSDSDAALFDSALGSDETSSVSVPCGPAAPGPCVETPSGLNPDALFSPPGEMGAQPAPFASAAPQAGNFASLSAGQGALTAQNNVPAFMGDFFGGAGITISSVPAGGVVSIPQGGTGVGVTKMAEGTSPIPRDRVFVSYNYFDNVNLVPGGVNVNRVVPGIEKTFFDGMMSLEVRVPMAWTVNSTTSFDVPNLQVYGYDTDQYELGNVTGFLKVLLYRNEQFAISGGLGLTLPTADDIIVYSPDFNAVLDRIENRSVHLLPFLGATYTPNDRWFAQSMLQVDVATSANSVYTTDPGLTLFREGSLRDPTYLFASVGTGYWMYRSANPSAFLSRAALLGELHYNTTLAPTDYITGVNANVGTRQTITTVNAVLGTNLMLGQDKSLLLGYVVPLGGGQDQAFDGEFRLLFNWYFGGTNRLSRAQF